MKTKEKKNLPNGKGGKSVMQQLRDIRDKLSADIQGMNHKQLKEYLENQKTLHSGKIWARERPEETSVSQK